MHMAHGHKQSQIRGTFTSGLIRIITNFEPFRIMSSFISRRMFHYLLVEVWYSILALTTARSAMQRYLTWDKTDQEHCHESVAPVGPSAHPLRDSVREESSMGSIYLSNVCERTPTYCMQHDVAQISYCIFYVPLKDFADVQKPQTSASSSCTSHV